MTADSRGCSLYKNYKYNPGNAYQIRQQSYLLGSGTQRLNIQISEKLSLEIAAVD